MAQFLGSDLIRPLKGGSIRAMVKKRSARKQRRSFAIRRVLAVFFDALAGNGNTTLSLAEVSAKRLRLKSGARRAALMQFAALDSALQYPDCRLVIRVAISPRSCQTPVASRRYRTAWTQLGGSSEASMGAVMIKCPDTGRDIPTGFVADRESFSSTAVFFARVLCPLCGKQHEWFAQQAWVCESEPRSGGRKAALKRKAVLS